MPATNERESRKSEGPIVAQDPNHLDLLLLLLLYSTNQNNFTMADVEEPVVEETPLEPVEVEIQQEEEEFVAVGGATEVKLFGKWSFDDIEIRDISLEVRD